ncbi:MAG TPA: flagellar hook-basal body complex protein FliE [Syntrophales bacterium]|mgnify:CR=1 FL=1|jgi:flagellar hook-basal body complex protein FliE|nr:flagellar hook-basal body complex protein FliE [Syntrophales bacterium]HPX55168.1 flagellar hook-basal body complex protein FliE [Syntrophales bacterium]HQA81878.1 flagellar hook-basal body complex protein FliE [Syntrophales bacterium]
MADMIIGSQPVRVPGGAMPSGAASGAGDGGFKNILKNAIEDVNTLQSQADDAVAKLQMNKGSMHEALIAMEKASLSFQTMLQVRNKIVDAYQEVMRMQV